MNFSGKPDLIVERERQLTQLLAAVEQAQQAARTLCNSRHGDNGVKLLFDQLDALRLEVEQLRRENGTGPFREIDPKWTGFLPWTLIREY